MRWRRAIAIGRESVSRYFDNGGPLLSAALAFFAILSIAPLVLVAVSVAAVAFGDEAARGELRLRLQDLIGPETADHIEATMESLRLQQQGHGSAALFGAALVLFGASRLFAQIQDAINQLWFVRTDFKDIRQGVFTTVRKKLVSFALVLVLGMFFTGSLVVNALAATAQQWLGTLLPDSRVLWTSVSVGTSVTLVAAMFTLIYRFMPNARAAWRDAAVGGTLAAALFTLAEYPLSYYLAKQEIATAFGAAGSLVIFLLWVYYAAQIFFFGAQLTWVVSRAGGRPMRPDPTAVIVKEVAVVSGADLAAADRPRP